MNATGLPMPTITSAPTQANVETLIPSAAAQAPVDFVLALAQMMGAAIPVAASEAGLPTETTPSDGGDEPATADAAALALLPLPIVATQQQPTAAQSAAGDPLEMLGLAPRTESANARDAALLQALTERLAGVEDTMAEMPAPAAATPTPALTEAVQHRATTPAHETAQHSRPLHQPVGTQAWTDELGTRLTMLAEKGGQHTASIRLSPEHLGPLEIRIAMREDQASVWFGAAHADTRAAIEHALPRLRELFAAEGMSLADAGVFREAPQQRPMLSQAPAHNGEVATTTEGESAPTRVQVGLLDAYA